MKLKPEFIVQDVDDTQFLVAVGSDDFHGIVRSNKTAAFIVGQLQEERTFEQLVEAVLAKYDVSRDVVEADVEKVLNTLREVKALDE